ncbi:MAG TPA: RidA family protein, partial [Gemmatimonadaceae bacterium]|nr:RidA family protein [Gemmatimonadaceae bacterium]
FFPSAPPRTTVQVSGLLVPGCKVEIDLWGVRPGVKREVVKGAKTPSPMAHYCQGIVCGDTLYAAGQIASDYKIGVPPEARQDPAFPYYGSDIQKQTRYIMENLRSVFQAAGCDLKDTVKSQVFLTDLNDFHYFDQVWKEFFPSPPPRTTVQVSGLLVPGCRIEIDLTAARP